MNCAYDEIYLQSAQRVMGDMYDYAVNTLKMPLKEFHRLFIHGGMCHQFEIGNSTYVAGKNGCEVAREVIEGCTDRRVDLPDEMYLDKSPEYWTGWALSFYQWKTNMEYSAIEECVPIDEICAMYDTLHEADISLFVEIMDSKCKEHREGSRLKRLRQYAGLTQRALAEEAGVPLRQIQLFEQGQRDIRKTQGQTLYQLSKALRCDIETIIKGL